MRRLMMDGKHRIGVALLLAAATAAGTVGIARSVGGAEEAAVTVTDSAIDQRQAVLDAAERDIEKSLANKPPKLPTAAAPSPTAAPPTVVVTRRAAPVAAPAGGGYDDDDEGFDDEDDHEDEGEHEGGDDD
jgi:hypothetical protein